jgi:hypothetical protein
MRTCLILLIAVILAASLTAAAASVSLTRVGEWGGEDRLVAVSGNLACVGITLPLRFLVIWHMFSPQTPV